MINEYLRDAELCSSTSMMLLLKSYDDMKKSVSVEDLIGALSERPSLPLIVALEGITGLNPVSVSDRGKLDKMARSWINWHMAAVRERER